MMKRKLKIGSGANGALQGISPDVGTRQIMKEDEEEGQFGTGV